MKTVALIGSHRSNQNTQKAIDHFFKQLKVEQDLSVYHMNKIDVQACIACDFCIPNQGKCVIEDDMQEIYQKVEACDLLIMASPVYFSSLPSKLKALIERTQMIFNLKDRSEIKGKKILIIGVGGAPSYPRQFRGIDDTLEWYKKTLNCEEIGFVTFSHTDVLPVLENEKSLKELEVIAQTLNVQ